MSMSAAVPHLEWRGALLLADKLLPSRLPIAPAGSSPSTGPAVPKRAAGWWRWHCTSRRGRKALHGFADDFQLADDSVLDEALCAESLLINACQIELDLRDGVLDVLEVH